MKFFKKLYIGGYPIKAYIYILFFFSVFGAIGIIEYAIGEHNVWARFALLYLLICFSLYHYSNATDKEDYKKQISRLNQKIRSLEDSIASDEQIINMLEKELEKTQNAKQQE